MIVFPETLVVIRCPFCQRQMLYRNISRFSMAEGVTLSCSCGADVLRIHAAAKNIYISCFCPCCQEEHQYIMSIKELLSNQAMMLECEETSLHLAYIGDRDEVLTELNAEGEQIICYQDMLREYFDQPSLMAKVLMHINHLYAQRKINCEACGSSDFNIEIFNDCLNIACAHCQQHTRIFAKRPLDLHLFRKVDRITMRKQGVAMHFVTKTSTVGLNETKKK